MKYSFLIIILSLITSASYGQMSCDDMMEHVEDEGWEMASYCCFTSKFLTGVKFYSLDIDYDTYYFAKVQFNYGRWYLYRVSSNTKSNFSYYAYTDQAGEAFHQYIHVYRDELGCAPELY